MPVKVTEYPIVAILWEDHISFRSEPIPDKVEITPTLTVGLLIKKTKKYLIVAYNIERYDDADDADYIIILRSTILSTKQYDTIKINSLRFKGEG